MKTVDEILERINYLGAETYRDLFGAARGDLVVFLPYEHAKPFLLDGTTPAQWQPKELTEEAVHQAVREYLDFAFHKAEDHRGLSASRSIDHMRAWFWLLGDEEFLVYADSDNNFQNYGVPILMKAAEKVGFPTVNLSEALQRMGRGEPCRGGCEEGCANI